MFLIAFLPFLPYFEKGPLSRSFLFRNSAFVLDYLLRLEPITTMFLALLQSSLLLYSIFLKLLLLF
jgi:hypothetical protein